MAKTLLKQKKQQAADKKAGKKPAQNQNQNVQNSKSTSSRQSRSRSSTSSQSQITTVESTNDFDDNAGTEEYIYFCTKCSEEVKFEAIECNSCHGWFHRACTSLKVREFEFLTECDESILWKCPDCMKVDGDGNRRITALETRMGELSSQTNSKMENMSGSMKLLQQQNQMILELLKNSTEEKIEEKITAQMSQHLEEKKEVEEKKNNIIIFNIEEEKGEKENEIGDLETVKKILKTVNPDTEMLQGLELSTVQRLGKKKKPDPENPLRPRPIKVTLQSTDQKENILKNCRALKNSAWEKIGISTEKTRRERDEEQSLRMECENRKKKGEDVYIDFRQKTIVTRIPKPQASLSDNDEGSTKVDQSNY